MAKPSCKLKSKRKIRGAASKQSRLQRFAESNVKPASNSEQRVGASKQDRVIAMLSSESGTTIPMIMRQTGWQQHSVRGFFAAVIRKRLKLRLASEKIDGQRIYRITSTDAVRTSRPKSASASR